MKSVVYAHVFGRVVELVYTHDSPCTTIEYMVPYTLSGIGQNQYMYYVYLLQSDKNNQIYTGLTDNLKRRLQEHKNGKVRTTNRLLPIHLIFYEAFINKDDAMRRERYLKSTKGKNTIKLMLREYLT